RIGAVAMTAQTIRMDIELQFFNSILGCSPSSVPGHQIARTAAAVRHHESHTGAECIDLDVDEDAPLPWPPRGPIPETRTHAHGSARARIPSLRPRAPRRNAPFEDLVAAH